MKHVLLDTSFLVSCTQWKIDFFTELHRICDFNFEVAILDRTMEELDNVIAKGGKEGLAAKLAKTILMTKRVVILPTTERKHVDKLLLEKAGEDYIVATQDLELKRLLKKKNQPVITIRQKAHLMLQGA